MRRDAYLTGCLLSPPTGLYTPAELACACPPLSVGGRVVCFMARGSPYAFHARDRGATGNGEQSTHCTPLGYVLISFRCLVPVCIDMFQRNCVFELSFPPCVRLANH